MGIIELSLYALLAALAVYIPVRCLSVFFEAFFGIFNFFFRLHTVSKKYAFGSKVRSPEKEKVKANGIQPAHKKHILGLREQAAMPKKGKSHGR